MRIFSPNRESLLPLCSRLDQVNNLGALSILENELRSLQNEERIYQQNVMKELIAISAGVALVLTSVFDPDNQFLPLEFVMYLVFYLGLVLVDTVCPEHRNRGNQLRQLVSQCEQKKSRIQRSSSQMAVGS